ncbi:MAG TPA: hypothetical protein VLS27_03930 [Gammaproteobacteria bacterium]|nr:hypothetical protein [Gammaproteobacteria bacterium]
MLPKLLPGNCRSLLDEGSVIFPDCVGKNLGEGFVVSRFVIFNGDKSKMPVDQQQHRQNDQNADKTGYGEVPDEPKRRLQIEVGIDECRPIRHCRQRFSLRAHTRTFPITSNASKRLPLESTVSLW